MKKEEGKKTPEEGNKEKLHFFLNEKKWIISVQVEYIQRRKGQQ